jgi:CrcB protein
MFMLGLVFIAIGGGIGALLRYVISGLTHRYLDGIFAWGTLFVNLIGSFAIGFFWELVGRLASANLRLFVFIGLLGAFTTFSTYSLETFNLLRDGEIKLGLLNILASNIFGIILVFFGFIASRYLTSLFR